MKPVAFDYARPGTEAEAVELLGELGGEAAVLAGGMSLGPMLNLRLVKPSMVVDIGGIADLAAIGGEGSTVTTGAALRQCDAMTSRELMELIPLLKLALPWVGHVQTRNRGTLGGSIAHADPSAEIPLCLATLNGQVVLRSKRGGRRVPARDFFLGFLSTARAPDELVISLEWPKAQPGEGFAFEEFAQRHGDFAIAAAACRVRVEEGAIAEFTLGLGGVEDRPIVFDLREFEFQPADDPGFPDVVADMVDERVDPISDQAASAPHRRMLARRLARRTAVSALKSTSASS